MIKTLTSLLAKARTLHAELELDHIELSPDSLIVGLQVTWSNNTPEPIDIRGVLIKVFHKGKKEEPVQIIYNGRFVRIPYQKGVTKIAGATSFLIEPGASLTECLRFLTYDVLDLNSGTYKAELHSIVEEGTYLHEFDLKVVPQLKHHAAGQESERGAAAPNASSAFTRALRIGVS